MTKQEFIDKVAFYVLGDWSKQQHKSFEATMRLCKDIAPNRFDGMFVDSVDEIAERIVSFV